MVGIVGYRDSEGGAEAHAVLCSLDPDPVVTIFCHAAHLLSPNALVETDNLAPIIPSIEVDEDRAANLQQRWALMSYHSQSGKSSSGRLPQRPQSLPFGGPTQ